MSGSILDVMSDYFTNSPGPKQLLDESFVSSRKLPVCPVQTDTWEVVSDPNRLMRTFEFTSSGELFSFLNEVLLYQEDSQHHGKITIDHRKVIIEVYTHDVNDVTEVDKEYAQVVDNILQDVRYFSMEEEGASGGEYR